MKNLQLFTLPVLVINLFLVSNTHAVGLDLAPLGGEMNCNDTDFAPSLDATGNQMVFNSRRSGSGYQDIYLARRNSDGSWSKPEIISEINSAYDDETPHISPDGKLIIFSSNRDGSTELPRDAGGTVRVTFDLYISTFSGGKWQKPRKLPGDVNTDWHERSPYFDKKSGYLYYTSWPFGDNSRSRILRARFDKGKFMEPEILPDVINAGFREMGPVVNAEGNILYFSSERPGGFGGQDIYSVSISGSKFGTPQNMGSKINTPANEMFYNKIGDRVYIAANRPNGPGNYDIYSNELSEELQHQKSVFQVRNAKTKEFIQTDVTVSASLKKDGRITSAKVSKNTDKNGQFVLQYHPELNKIFVEIEKNGFLPFRKELSPDAPGEKSRFLDLVPIEKDGGFEIHSVHFDYNSSEIKNESYVYLDSLAGYLKKNSLRYRIIGHTDMHGSDTFNQKLSLDRAKAVREYLVSKGLSESRFETEGAGKSRPLANGIGEEFDSKNRRTEFRRID